MAVANGIIDDVQSLQQFCFCCYHGWLFWGKMVEIRFLLICHLPCVYIGTGSPLDGLRGFRISAPGQNNLIRLCSRRKRVACMLPESHRTLPNFAHLTSIRSLTGLNLVIVIHIRLRSPPPALLPDRRVAKFYTSGVLRRAIIK